jgi:hypothetical protein
MGRKSGFTPFRTETWLVEKLASNSGAYVPEVSPRWDAPLQEVHYLNQFVGFPGRPVWWEAGSHGLGGRFVPSIYEYCIKGFILMELCGLYSGPIVGEYALYE